MPLQIFHRIEGFCVFFCQRQPLFIPCQIVSQPHAARKETGAPVINRYIGDTTICIDGSWIQNFTGFLDNVCLNCVLCYSVVDVVLNKIDFNLFCPPQLVKIRSESPNALRIVFIIHGLFVKLIIIWWQK